MARIRVIASKAAIYLDWIVTIGLAAVISVLGLSQNATAQTISSATLLVLCAFAIGAIRDRAAARRLQTVLDDLPASVRIAITDSKLIEDANRTGLARVLPQTVNFNWLPDIASAQRVSIAKLKLNFTEDPEYFLAFEKVLSRGGTVSIVLADPRSPAMWLRHQEEPRGKIDQIGGETAWVIGLGELAVEIAHLDSWRRRMRQNNVELSGLRIGLFPHYPTHAFYRFDDRLYVFHYPYMARGFHAPAFLFDSPSAPTHSFLLKCNDFVIESSIELDDEVVADVAAKYRNGHLSEMAVDKSEIRIVRKRRQT